MGTNCAVFIANMFCFTYEYDFISRLIAAQRVDILSHFIYTLRFVDDLLSCNNPVFEKYLYTNISDEDGIHGIYPPFLRVNCEQVSVSQVSFLDVLLYKAGRVFATKIYDKREHPPLSLIDQTKYPHPSCFLSERSQYGIVTSRLHCFGRICHKKVDFVQRSKKFIRDFLNRGYSKRKVSAFIKRFLKQVPLEFSVERLGSFTKALFESS